MTSQKDNNPYFTEMENIWRIPALQKCISDIESFTGYKLSPESQKPFICFHAFVSSDPPPSYISAWRSDVKSERWYRNHVGGILGHVQSALACVCYHRDNLCAIEESVRQIFVKSGVQEILGNTTVALGNTIRWDAEYQAFVLSVRRCLDYIARALAAYFKYDGSSGFVVG